MNLIKFHSAWSNLELNITAHTLEFTRLAAGRYFMSLEKLLYFTLKLAVLCPFETKHFTLILEIASSSHQALTLATFLKLITVSKYKSIQ